MQGIRRQRRSARAWRALLAQFVDSGLTVAAFCRHESVGTNFRTPGGGFAPVRLPLTMFSGRSRPA